MKGNLNMEREKELLLNAGKAIILANHNRFVKESGDNDELTQACKTSILALKKFCAIEIDKNFSEELAIALVDYARDLFTKTWLEYASEDENADTLENEKKLAIKTFNNSYKGQQ